MKVVIRSAEKKDLPQILRLFESTIDAACAEDYTVEQRRVWKLSTRNVTLWLDKMESGYFIVAELLHEMAGFASLKEDGYVDLLYVGKQYLRQGVGKDMLRHLETRALQLGCAKLNSDASVTARSFFKKNGFVVIARQAKIIDTVEIVNFKMEKDLIQQ